MPRFGDVLERIKAIVGTLADAASTTVNTTTTAMSYIKGILNQLARLLAVTPEITRVSVTFVTATTGAQPGQVSFGVTTVVPYKGTGPAMNDLVAGQIDVMCDQTTNTTKQIQGGTIKAYAVTSPARLDVLKDVPTAVEGGLADFQVGIWHGVYAPKGTPSEAVERLSKSLQVALRDENVVARFAELGTAPSPEADATPAALKANIDDLPAGGKRLIQRTDGFDATIVSGAVVYRHGEATGALPGRLIRGTREA